MNKLSFVSGALVAGALVLGSALPASAATVAPASQVVASHVVVAKVVSFKNCTALSKKYPGGVAKAGVKYNKVSGKNRAFKIKPTSSTALYNANKKLDRDKDGVACEK